MNENIIAIRKIDICKADEAFAELMHRTENYLNNKSKQTPNLFQKLTPAELEYLSTDTIKQVCIGTPFTPDQIMLVSGQRFPDIIAGTHYGVEVKSTNKNHWISTGGSIVESTRDKYVENVYMLFGKLGGNPPEFKCRPYQDVLYDIAVTHSPRYLINMELDTNESIFNKMQTSYDALRTSPNLIEQVRTYYKNKALKENKKEMPWWISDSNVNSTTGFNIRLWSTIDAKEKDELIALSMILFPETITPKMSKHKYSNFILWLCSYRQIVCPNVRDIFSAGGKIKSINGRSLSNPIPQVFANIVKYSKIIEPLINSNDEDIISMIAEYNPNLLKNGKIYNNWLNMCQNIADTYSKDIPLLDWIADENINFEF